jgi:branched-chain amino acid transport system permease protein
LIRAGASNAPMVSALGVNIKMLNTLIFGLGAGLAGLAGLMAAPILSVQSGMGEAILIQTLVVIIVGGIGSIRGAFLAALIVGVVDTLGRIMLPIGMAKIMDASLAQAAGPAIASMLIYVLMAAVLAFKPMGLFPVNASR